jgi:hypothetical protein
VIHIHNIKTAVRPCIRIDRAEIHIGRCQPVLLLVYILDKYFSFFIDYIASFNDPAYWFGNKIISHHIPWQPVSPKYGLAATRGKFV